MTAVTLRIDRLALLGLADVDEPAITRAVQDALRRLAERLARSPWARSGPQELALDELTLGTVAADELLGERGAERLADALYSALSRRFE